MEPSFLIYELITTGLGISGIPKRHEDISHLSLPRLPVYFPSPTAGKRKHHGFDLEIALGGGVIRFRVYDTWQKPRGRQMYAIA